MVGKIEEPLPVVIRDVVLSRPNMVSDPIADGMIGRGHFGGAEPFVSEQPIHRRGVDGAEKFAAGIGRKILGGAGDVQRARSDKCEQHVLIEREVGCATDEAAKAFAISPCSVFD